jgi:hypothetical protein
MMRTCHRSLKHLLNLKDPILISESYFCWKQIFRCWNSNIYLLFFIKLSPQVKQSKSETVCQNIKVNGSDVVLDRISYLAVFILFVIRSNLGIILWIFKWRNETNDENLSQKLEETSIEFKDPILISESSSGPRLVSNPDIINNIWELAFVSTI